MAGRVVVRKGLIVVSRSLLSSRCQGVTKAVVTQANTPLGSKMVYDGEKRKPLHVTPELFSTFVKVCLLRFVC